MGKNILYFIVAFLILLIVVGVIVFLVSRQSEDAGELQQSSQPTQTQEDSLGGELYQNPGAEVPETNPFGRAKTNPFENYKNPFD